MQWNLIWDYKDKQHRHEEKTTQVRMTIAAESGLCGIYRGQRKQSAR